MSNFTENQLEVVMHEKGNLLVSASAGSGKTYTMISRAIRLIKEKKTKVSNLLALTFTEAAALEMKEKLKKAMFGLIADGGEEYALQISDLDCADISTLHAFCGRLIRAYFFECGVSPDFKILDAEQATLYKNTALDGLFRKLYEVKEPYFLELLKCYKYKRKDDELKKLLLSVYDKIKDEPEFERALDGVVALYTEEKLDETIYSLKERFNERANQILDSLAWALAVFKEAKMRPSGLEITSYIFDTVLESVNGDYYGLSRYKDFKISFQNKPFGQGLKGDVLCAKDAVMKACKDFEKLVSRFSKDVKDRQTYVEELNVLKNTSENFARLIKDFSAQYAMVKREENALDFSDLEHFAITALQNKDIREEVKNKFDFIFVDEYQDTNSVQELIVSLIANDNVFMVGDDKQSIYGFRGCDPEIFLNKEKELPSSGGKALRLNHNFRSAIKVINAVNSIFAFSMTESVYGYSYLKKAMLTFGGNYPEGADGRVELHVLDTSLTKKEKKEKTIRPIYDLKEESLKLFQDTEEEKNVDELALLVADIIEKECQKEYYDLKDEEFKPVTFSDIVILSRSVETAYVRRLASTLYRLGVPVNSKVSVNALDFPEVITLVKFMELLENASLDVALVSVMKSVIGDFSDEELYDMASLYHNSDKRKEEHGGFYNAYVYALEHAEGKLKEKLTAFDCYIKECRELKDFIGASGILEKVISDTGYYNYILTLKEGKLISQVVESFVSKSMVGDKILTVSELIEKTQYSKDAFSVETSVGGNAVRIMTIHASKGLEFPVVIVCGLEKGSNKKDENKEILFSRENGFLVKYYDTDAMKKEETPFRLLEKEKMEENSLKEELRLFYVALTRASYSLHMVAKCSKDLRTDIYEGGDKYLQYIPASFPATVHSLEEFNFSATKYEPRKVLVGKTDERRKEEIRCCIDFLYPYLLDVNVPLKTSVTSSLHIEDKTLIDENETKDDSVVINVSASEDGEDIPAQTSKERGTIAHKILELYDFDRGNLPLQIQEMLEKSLLTKEQADSVDVGRLDGAIKSNVISVIRGKKLYKEAPFFANFKAFEVLDTASEQNVLVQGVVDLLAVGDDGECAIIDYKYSVLSPNKLKAKYQKQLSLYKLAVERVLGVKVSSTYLLNIYSGDVIKL